MMVGIFAKLYSRGGDSVAHSSVAACHGFGPAFWPRFRLRITFVKSMITPIATWRPWNPVSTKKALATGFEL